MKQLLFSITKKDLEINYFSGSGAGGQHRNKHQNCVRLRHPESGANSVGQSSRDRLTNLKEALHNLVKTPKFKLWHSKKVYELSKGKTIDEIVEEQMAKDNLKIECSKNGRWEKCQNVKQH